MNIYSKRHLIENSHLILSKAKSILSNRLNEVTALKDTGHGWFKESLVIYFSTMVSDKQIEMVEAKLGMKDADQAELPPLKLPTVSNFDNYGLGKNTLPGAIQHLSEDVIPTSEKKLYYNAISSAKLIRGLYGGKKIDPKRVDMGIKYDSIRKRGVELAKKSGITGITADKWCPADIYIYNDLSDITRASNAKYLNIDIGTQKSLNGLFQSEPETETSKGILGLSLKEQIAQAGAATSFKNILSREKNYPDADKIDNRDALSIIYHLDNFRVEYAKEKSTKEYYFSNLAYAYASAISLIERRKDSRKIVTASKNALNLIETIFSSTLGDNLPPKVRGKYVVNKVRDAFNDSNISKFVVPNAVASAIKNISSAIEEDAISEYTKMRQSFLRDLVAAGYKSPQKLYSPNAMRGDIGRALAKAGCYKVASYVLKGMSLGELSIPTEFSTIAKQKNVFVAMVAYAVGMAGLSPTFFKVKGSQKPGGTAHMEAVYGSGYFHLDDDSEVKIIDKETTAGFRIEFTAKVTKTAKSSSKTLQKYQTIMIYHSAGDHISVLVNKLDVI